MFNSYKIIIKKTKKTFSIRGNIPTRARQKKLAFLADASAKGALVGLPPPLTAKFISFSECTEIKEYAKIFCKVFARVSVKNLDAFF